MIKVLIAEDDDAMRDMLSKMMVKMGYIPISASNGRRALDIAEDNPDIALVLTDVNMPEMDGRELVRRLRSRADFSRKPIIIFSGVVGPKEIADVLDIGATAFLPKPIKFEDLWEYMMRFLSPEDQM